ncbi:hypothetical protein ACH42_06805 [Endozoicomonas sp. (ex Bugula neritina AB1)]|nr:hypothetical protein ACH42_06805 [Endozoicomonas sp. (ex Bugula neritina AB1)]
MRYIISLFTVICLVSMSQTGFASDEMDSAAFMKLLLTQLAYQDPTEPMDNADMVSQLSDLAMMEQNAELVASMESLRKQVYDSQGLYASNLVGEGVMVVANLFVVEDGRHPEGEVLLSYKASALNIEVYNDGDKPEDVDALATLELGAQDDGQVSFNLGDLEEPLKDGTYRMYAYGEVDDQEMEMVIVQHSVVTSVVFPGNGTDILLDVEGVGLVPITSVTEFEGDYVAEDIPGDDEKEAATQGQITGGMSQGQLQQKLKKIKRDGDTWTSNPLFQLKQSIKTSKQKPTTRRSAMFRSL